MIDTNLLIGVFDTGRGGQIVAEELRPLFKNATFRVADDAANAPYGSKSDSEIQELSVAAVQQLVDAGCRIIIVACNTATTIAIAALRQAYPKQKFIGMEPMVKPAAAATKTGMIAVLATPATLHSQRYTDLKDTFASGITICEPDCSEWARQIQEDNFPLQQLDIVVDEISSAGCDQVVIACTHYLAIKDELADRLPSSIEIQDPIPPIAKRLHQLASF